jgi:hypothetical protein
LKIYHLATLHAASRLLAENRRMEIFISLVKLEITYSPSPLMFQYISLRRKVAISTKGLKTFLAGDAKNLEILSPPCTFYFRHLFGSSVRLELSTFIRLFNLP